MANPTPALKYQVQSAIFDNKSMLDETNFYHQRQGQPSELTRKLTYIMGDYTRAYPISLATAGGIGYNGSAMKNTAVELDDPQFTYPVMGRMYKAAIVSSSAYSAGDKPGIGNSLFKIRFRDNSLKRYWTIVSARGIQAYLHDDGTPISAGEYEYTAQLDPALPEDSCPLSELEANAAWIGLNPNVAESESRTTESKMAVPGKYKNQMSFLRFGWSWAGNAANKVMRIDVTKPATDGSPALTSNVWMDFAMWQYELEWLSICEHAYWYSRYNRQINGTVSLKDLLTGKVIPKGSGLLEQIQNKGTYSDLTYDYLTNNIGDALFGQSDTEGMSMTLYGGMGARRVFHNAIMKAGGKLFTNFSGAVDSGKFVSGTGYNLALGGYFDAFYHVDGYFIKFKHNPIFDMGKVAVAQKAGGYTHPETGWPLESYRMVFIDDNDYDGQPNIQLVTQKGRSFLHGVIPGLTPMPRSLQIMGGFNVSSSEASAAQLISTDVDKSAYTRFKSCGIQIRRANRCFDFQCTAGQ